MVTVPSAGETGSLPVLVMGGRGGGGNLPSISKNAINNGIIFTEVPIVNEKTCMLS